MAIAHRATGLAWTSLTLSDKEIFQYSLFLSRGSGRTTRIYSICKCALYLLKDNIVWVRSLLMLQEKVRRRSQGIWPSEWRTKGLRATDSLTGIIEQEFFPRIWAQVLLILRLIILSPEKVGRVRTNIIKTKLKTARSSLWWIYIPIEENIVQYLTIDSQPLSYPGNYKYY